VAKILINASLAASLHNFRGPLIRELVATGFEVHVSAPAFRPLDRELIHSLGAHIHEVSLARSGFRISEDLRYLLLLYRLIRSIRPDRVLNYTIKPNIWGSIAARMAGVPAASMITGLGFAFAPSVGLTGWLIQFIARSLYRIALTKNFVIFFQNPDDLADFKRFRMLSNSSRVRIINGSGVDLDRYCAAPLPEQPVFLMIARLLGAKGIREYAAACRVVKSNYPAAKFILVGPSDNGPDGISAENAVEMCTGVVEYLGAIEDVRPVIAKASVYVLPSYREGTPRSSLEAMAMGRPVVTTDAPGCNQTVIDGENGFLVPIGDIDGLALAMSALARQPELRRHMGEKSLIMAQNRFDVKIVNKAIIDEIK
jgi:glycosyltransferase involved in cell wall biosynthesis